MLSLVLLYTLLLGALTSSDLIDFSHHRRTRYLVYAPRATFKLVLSMAIPFPIDVKGKYLAWTMGFQFQYQLPLNFSDLRLPVDWRRSGGTWGRSLRSLDRTTVYNTLENYMDDRGMTGRECLLQSICESAAVPLHHDGLLGQIMQIIFTPHHVHEGYTSFKEHVEARLLGERGVDCGAAYPTCRVSLLDLVSRVHED
ncbi:hypothetical protein B566_EDAN008667 [Ephemera danica]|nr:hypothetical protein B566_EDAN008667 [Ephemera danica]